jgi:uncharacterized glyoxalase superfamily protein PhnB
MQTASIALKSLSPVLIVDSVDEASRFWVDRLGFARENEVPAGDGTLVFASVRKDGIEIMYQSKASVIAEDPEAAGGLAGRSAALFITVPGLEDLDAIEEALREAPMIKPRHDTFYGTTEFYVREPGGSMVGFAAHR